VVSLNRQLSPLEEASQRFEAASRGRVAHVGVDWPQFAAIRERMARLRKAAAELLLDGPAERELRELGGIVARLGRAPIHPSHAGSGIASLLGKTRPKLPASLADPHREILVLIEAIADSRHPAADLEATLAKPLPRVDVSGRNLILVGGSDLGAAQECLAVPDRGAWEVVDLVGLLRGSMGDVVFVFGPPSQHEWGWDINRCRQMVSWIFSAPAGMLTVNVSWTSSLDLGKFSIWPEAPIRDADRHGTAVFNVDESSDDHIPPLPPLPIDPDGVDSDVARLVGGGEVAFHRDFGPRPQIVDVDEISVDVRRVSSAALETGSLLVLRADESENDEIRKIARGKLGAAPYDGGLDASARFKSAIIAVGASDGAESVLRRAGVDNPEYYLNAVRTPRYLGPQDAATMQRICEAFGIAFVESDFEAIQQVRVAHRQAGAVISGRVAKALEGDTAWIALAREGAQVWVEVEGAGSVVLATVAKVDRMKRLVSHLGVPRKLPEQE